MSDQNDPKDTEGHIKRLATDEDTEGNMKLRHASDDDTEGHIKPVPAASDDDDTEGHRTKV